MMQPEEDIVPLQKKQEETEENTKDTRPVQVLKRVVHPLLRISSMLSVLYNSFFIVII